MKTIRAYFSSSLPTGRTSLANLQPSAFDSSAAHTGKHFPAASGLFVGADGRVLVVGPQTPTRDSLDYTLLNNSGVPSGRFALPVRTRPLLYAGDSLLVQRPGANASSELRWLVIGKH